MARSHPEKLIEFVGRWVTRRDAEKYVYNNWEKCVNSVLHGAAFKNTNIPPGYTFEDWSISELLAACRNGGSIEVEGDWQ